MKITREQMIEKVYRNCLHYEAKIKDLQAQKKGSSFAMIGARRRRGIANELLDSLQTGGNPSQKEVVAYFGKGATYEKAN